MLKSNKKNLVLNSSVMLHEHIEAEGKGRKFVSRFIEAGVAHYQEFGDILITKETLDKFIHTMVGCPVIINHKDITDKNADDERVGVVSNVWYNECDGWYYCDGIIWDKQAIDLVKNHNWNVSCTYDFESDFIEKTHNGKKIDMEFTNGKFLHLALVNNPRYERANIVMNGKDKVENDKWITVHPNGEDEKGRPLLIKDGETPKEAMQRQWGADVEKKGKKESKKKFETHYIVWQKNNEPYILDKTSFENWKEDNKEHISTSDIDAITHTDIEEFRKDIEGRGIDIEKEGGTNYLISQIADLKKEQRKSDTKDKKSETSKDKAEKGKGKLLPEKSEDVNLLVEKVKKETGINLADYKGYVEGKGWSEENKIYVDYEKLKEDLKKDTNRYKDVLYWLGLYSDSEFNGGWGTASIPKKEKINSLTAKNGIDNIVANALVDVIVENCLGE